jgi:hypothetical protein
VRADDRLMAKVCGAVESACERYPLRSTAAVAACGNDGAWM